MSLPTLAQVDELGTLLTCPVPARYEDLNGHVNVRGHYDLHMDGAELVFEEGLGINPGYLERTGHSSFSAAHHIEFHSEIMVGHEVSVHLRFLGRGTRTIHGATVLVNRTRGRIASTVEFVEAYVDLATRRSAPIADDLAARVDAELARHQALDWTLLDRPHLGVSRS